MSTSIHYPVSDCYPSIQGEGVHTGVPMVVLRLQGCDVGCPFCDTKFTWTLNPEQEVYSWEEALGETEHYTVLSPSQINAEIARRYPHQRWVMLTGGEPARWYLKPLIMALHDGGKSVTIETSGTEIGCIDAGIDWVTLSPKYRMPGGKELKAEVFAIADEIKMVIGRARDIELLDELLDTYKTKESVQICLQPMSLSQKATALCIEAVAERGWRLSIQTHRLLALK